jgi:hypothetical protein
LAPSAALAVLGTVLAAPRFSSLLALVSAVRMVEGDTDSGALSLSQPRRAAEAAAREEEHRKQREAAAQAAGAEAKADADEAAARRVADAENIPASARQGGASADTGENGAELDAIRARLLDERMSVWRQEASQTWPPPLTVARLKRGGKPRRG